jgi:hypothetical protein
MSRRSRPTALVALFALTLVAACGGGDDTSTDAGPPRDLNTPAACPASDGTIASDCARFACQYRNASLLLCTGGGTTLTFNCVGVDGFPADYQTTLRAYFTGCGPTLEGIVASEVETTTGPVTIPACGILQCAAKPASGRLFEGGPSIKAECAPVPSPACDFPDPP